MGVTQHIHQGEGGEQGDLLMPLLFALGQHSALVAAAERLRDGERLMAFLDDTYIVCAPDRVGRAFSTVEQEFAAPCPHPPASRQDTSLGIVEEFCPEERERDHQVGEGCEAWCSCMEGRPRVASHRTGGEGSGSAHWHTRIRAGVSLQRRVGSRKFCSKGFRGVNDLQAAWLILLMCGSTRANFWFEGSRSRAHCRVCGPSRCQGVGDACARSWGVPSGSAEAQVVASLALSAGGLGLTSARRTRTAAHWASWADCLRMVSRQRHGRRRVDDHPTSQHGTAPCFRSVQECGRSLAEAVCRCPCGWELVRVPPLSWRSTQNPTSQRWVGSDKV